LNNNVRLTIDGKRQKLEIVKATRTDTGVYGCQVHEQTCTAKLTVEGNNIWKYCIFIILTDILNNEGELLTIE